jgi:hypothetical protein
MLDEIAYELWDDYHKHYYLTNMFFCIGVTKSGDRCHIWVSGGKLFCHVHKEQKAMLEQECRKFFKVRV